MSMAMAQVKVGQVTYPTQKAAKEAVRTILYACPIGHTLSGPDAAFMLDLLDLHPEADDKVGCGVESIQVEQNYGSRGFWLTRRDGSRTDFSFLACIRPPTTADNARAAFRSEIREQVHRYRDEQFNGDVVRCDVTGVPVTRGEAHIDHATPLRDLLLAFLAIEGLDLDGVAVQPTRDGETTTELLDRGLAARWGAYHAANARLRVVTRHTNLSTLRRSR